MKHIKIAIFAFILLSISGCSFHQYIYEAPELRQAISEKLSPKDAQSILVPFEPSPEMLEFAKKAVGQEVNPIDKSLNIVEALLSNWEIDLDYERTADFTARQVFHKTRRANCLAFTHLFVSLARSVDVRAHYVDVKFENQLEHDGFVISNHHICAGVYDGAEFFLIDFDPDPRKNYRVYRVIDDIEALANHYNNIAVNRYSKNPDEISSALKLINLALEIKPDFTRALNNRGVILSVMGYESEAEAAFRKALSVDENLPDSNANLAGLLLKKGKTKEALPYSIKAVTQRPGYILYRQRLGINLLHLGDYRKAMKQFKRILADEPDNFLALQGIALAYFHLDNIEKAEDAVNRALSLNPDHDETKRLALLIKSQH